jgi:ATP/maltotriose-dependent transcriptional regulator MalT
MGPRIDDELVGRAREGEQLTAALAASRVRPGGILVMEGEPGIGKSRLLLELTRLANQDWVVLTARASEFERDLPYALWSGAVDGYVRELGERRVRLLGIADLPALAMVAPTLEGQGPGSPVADRHRTHRALRDLLERLAAARPLLVCLDDVHWADLASVEMLAALVHRPPAAEVLIAVTVREAQLPSSLARALAAAMVEDRVTRVEVGPLTEVESEQLVGIDVAAIYPLSGGNPFYVQQLARVFPGPATDSVPLPKLVPPAVAASLASELAELSASTRLLIEAAAVVGDPFEPDLAAEVAEIEEASALPALDDLLARTLVRPADVPRRFAFRHPLVRHAVYETSAGGWRLGAHARAAEALERRGAGVVARAHHVEHAAHAHDETAIRVLTQAAQELHAPAPASAARFYRAALRLVPDTVENRARRALLEVALAEDLQAAGDASRAREGLLSALGSADGPERLALTVRVASAELWLGRYEQARRHLHVALGELPAEPSADRVRLRMLLGLTELFDCDLVAARGQAREARADTRALGDQVNEGSALAMEAVALVCGGAGEAARGEVEMAAAALGRLTDSQQATRLPALWMVGRARRVLGDFEAAVEILGHGSQLAGRTGRETALFLLATESVPALIELGRLDEAMVAAERGLELARLAGAPQLVWAHCALVSAQLAAGDVRAALAQIKEAAGSERRPDFAARGQPGWCLGAALTAAGNPEQGAGMMLGALGGPDLTLALPVERPTAAADLVDALLACDRLDDAAQVLATGEAAAASAGTDWAAIVTSRARAAVLLAQGQAPAAAAAAGEAVRLGRERAPLTAARAGVLHGRALAATGDRPSAIAALIAAESALDRFGAVRWRDEAVRELRHLGHRVRRAARDATSGALGPLTAREREIAGLVAAGRTNREVAEQLVLSAKTIEAHLRNIFAKLGVRSRVELTREVQRDAGSISG